MATPREQHAARGHAHVVGSGHLDGREPLVEDRDAAAANTLQRGDGQPPSGERQARDAGLQRAVDAASGEPRTGGDDAMDDSGLHPAPRDQRPHPDNTDRRG